MNWPHGSTQRADLSRSHISTCETRGDCYLSWGADGKVQQLDQLYPHLRKEEPVARRARNHRRAGRAPGARDRSQSVASRLRRDCAGKALDTLLRTAIEHAGAERGLLMLPRGGELWIEAEANTSGSAVTVRLRETPASGG